MSARRLMSVEVRGREKRWLFNFYGDPAHLAEWRADGLDVEYVLNIIPAWWVDLGLPVSWWCFWQDVANLKNPWGSP